MFRLWHNETDTYVARDAEHAARLFNEHNGYEGAYDAEQYGAWRESAKSLDSEMTIALDDGNAPTTKTIAEWIAETVAERPEGGMLCSTEW